MIQNEQLVQQLELTLELAKKGEVTSIVLVGSYDTGGSFYQFTLNDPLALIGQMELVKKKLLSIAEDNPKTQ